MFQCNVIGRCSDRDIGETIVFRFKDKLGNVLKISI